MKAVVTGAAGFIGSHVSEALLQEGYQVIGVDNYNPENDLSPRIRRRTAHQLANGFDGFHIADADVTRPGLMETLITPDVGLIVHLAALPGVRRSWEMPGRVAHTNVEGTAAVLSAAESAGVRHVVLASSSSVYGEADPQRGRMREWDAQAPVNPYGTSKRAAEAYAELYREERGMTVPALRFFTVYGSRMRPNMAISNFASRALRGEPPIVYGSGVQQRDFTYIDDAVDGLMRAIETDVNWPMNIGSGSPVEIREVAELVIDAAGADVEYETAERPAERDKTHADITVAEHHTDYTPSTSLEEGIKATVDWVADHLRWYDA